MKLIYNPTPKYSFDIEGSPAEIFEFVQRITVSARELPASTQLQIIEPTIRQRNSDSPFTDDFVKSIYLYEANPANDSGRGAYIATQILKGETLNIDKLAKRSQGSRSTVFATIKRMVENGCEIDVTPTTIKLISVPQGPYKLKTYSRTVSTSRKTKSVSSATVTQAPVTTVRGNDLMSALSSVKLG